LFAGGLAALTGCTNVAVPMYGVEMPMYGFAGHVVDAGSGAPVPGIQVRFGGDEQLADDAGAWVLWGRAPEDCEPGACIIQARDVDGDDHGRYAPTEVQVLHTDNLDADATDVIIQLTPLHDTGAPP